MTCFRIIQACGLLDTLNKVRDEKYEELYPPSLWLYHLCRDR